MAPAVGAMRFWRTLLVAIWATPVVLGTALPASAQAVPRWGHTTTLLPNGNILVVGGASNAAGDPTDSVEIDISTDGLIGFQVGTPLLVARASHTATLLPDGRVAFSRAWAWVCAGTGINASNAPTMAARPVIHRRFKAQIPGSLVSLRTSVCCDFMA